MIRGPSTQDLYYHFAQRWSHAFTNDNHSTKNLKFPKFLQTSKLMKDPEDAQIHKSTLQTIRAWPAVLERNVLLDMFCSIINSAKEYIYFEHQWPFHNFVLTQCMCEALNRNPDLHVIIVAPIKTDLPKGFVGSYLDMSQDQSKI
jgi:phosphatidylserine/phosphatidylglycerophosphate/cardiolipin synthase-like enzyme